MLQDFTDIRLHAAEIEDMHVEFVRSVSAFTKSCSAALSADQESASLEFPSEVIAVGRRQGSKAELEGIGPAKVKVLVACEDYGFGVNCFLKLIVQVFFSRFCFLSVGRVDVGESVKRRVGGPKGGGPKMSRFFPSPVNFTLSSLGVFSWNLGLTSRRKTQRADEETQLPLFEWTNVHETATHLDFSVGEAQPRWAWRRFARTEWMWSDVPTPRRNHSKHRELVNDPASSSEQRFRLNPQPTVVQFDAVSPFNNMSRESWNAFVTLDCDLVHEEAGSVDKAKRMTHCRLLVRAGLTSPRSRSAFGSANQHNGFMFWSKAFSRVKLGESGTSPVGSDFVSDFFGHTFRHALGVVGSTVQHYAPVAKAPHILRIIPCTNGDSDDPRG